MVDKTKEVVRLEARKSELEFAIVDLGSSPVFDEMLGCLVDNPGLSKLREEIERIDERIVELEPKLA